MFLQILLIRPAYTDSRGIFGMHHRFDYSGYVLLRFWLVFKKWALKLYWLAKNPEEKTKTSSARCPPGRARV